MSRRKLFAISNTAELAELLGVSVGKLNHMASGVEKQYHTESRRKPDGTKRMLGVPSEPLKKLQRKVLDMILCKVPVLPCVYCREKGSGKSPTKNAALHTNKAVVFKMDIAQCFPSIKPDRVSAIFRSLGFGSEAAGLLTRLTTRENELPQGVPTSTALANLALAGVDSRITKLQAQHGFDYSRWVDDMTFSGPMRLKKLRRLFQRIVESEGFNVKAEKTRTEFAKERQTVMNLVVNTKVNLPREKRAAIKKESVTVHLSGQELSASLAGKVYWLRSVNPQIGAPLAKRVLGK